MEPQGAVEIVRLRKLAKITTNLISVVNGNAEERPAAILIGIEIGRKEGIK